MATIDPSWFLELPEMNPRDPLLVLTEHRVRDELARREKMVADFLESTGLEPSACELVEERYADGSRRVFVRRRHAAL